MCRQVLFERLHTPRARVSRTRRRRDGGGGGGGGGWGGVVVGGGDDHGEREDKAKREGEDKGEAKGRVVRVRVRVSQACVRAIV